MSNEAGRIVLDMFLGAIGALILLGIRDIVFLAKRRSRITQDSPIEILDVSDHQHQLEPYDVTVDAGNTSASSSTVKCTICGKIEMSDGRMLSEEQAKLRLRHEMEMFEAKVAHDAAGEDGDSHEDS